MTHSTRRPALRRTLRLAVPVIALAALALAGEPLQESSPLLAKLCEPAPAQLVGTDTSAPVAANSDLKQAEEHRSRSATRIRWSLTLPMLSRPPGHASGT